MISKFSKRGNIKKLRLSLQLFLVFIGLIKFIGDTFHLPKLEQLGFAIGVSPLPIVFSDRTRMEDFAHKITIRYNTKKNPASKSKEFDRAAFREMNGPLYFVGAYTIALAYSSRFPPFLWKPALEKGFCRQGPLALALKETSDMASATIVIEHLSNQQLHWENKITCD